jgi:hypothetical protein
MVDVARRMAVPSLPSVKSPATIPDGISFESDGWKSTPLLRRPITRKGTPRSAERDAPQARHLEFGLIVFLASAAMLFFMWLAIRGPALLERLSSWRPICFLVSCETRAQPRREAHAEPEPKSQPQPQPPAQPQAQPRPQWAHYSTRLREPQRRSPIECWRDRSIRGPCFD